MTGRRRVKPGRNERSRIKRTGSRSRGSSGEAGCSARSRLNGPDPGVVGPVGKLGPDGVLPPGDDLMGTGSKELWCSIP